VAHLPRLALSPAKVFEVQRGGLIRTEDLPVDLQGLMAGPVAAVDGSGRLIAILKEARPGLLKPSPNFLAGE